MGILSNLSKPHGMHFADPKTYKVIDCPECDGKGKVPCPKCDLANSPSSSHSCYYCNSTGYVTCPECNGEGWHTEPR